MDDRAKSLEDFIASNNKSAIIASSALGTGMDIPRVGQVTFFDAYFELTNFVQQSGRAAREPDLHVRCVCYVPRSVFDIKSQLLKSKPNTIIEAEKVAIAKFLITSTCRRLILAKHMDDDPHGLTCVEQDMDRCDNCLDVSPGSVPPPSEIKRRRFPSSFMGPPPQIFPPPEAAYGHTIHLHGSVDESSPSMGQTSIITTHGHQHPSPSDRRGSRTEDDSLSPVNSPSPLKRQRTSESYPPRMINREPFYQYPKSRSRYPAREFLKATLNDMVSSCPVCWFQNDAEHTYHSFQGCPRKDVLDYNSYVGFVKQVIYHRPFACALMCHSPRFVCAD